MDAERRVLELLEENARLRQRIAELERVIEELRRGGKRQAAPFRRPEIEQSPKKPGRKRGRGHGKHHHRAAPPPEVIDETHDAPLPEKCPHCGDRRLEETHTDEQFQVEIPRRPIHRRFVIHVGCCRGCRRSVRGRHPLQTSDATGAAASQAGPDLAATMVYLNKELGVSHGKIVRFIERCFGIKLARATSARVMAKAARKLVPAYEQIVRDVRGSPWSVCDETGWRIGGENAWLHVVVGPSSTCYLVDRSRGHEPVALILGSHYSGVLVHDGWSPYDRFTAARHQQCLAHLVRRCRELLERASRGAVRFPRGVLELLRAMLDLRTRRDAQRMSRKGLAREIGRLRARLERLVWPVKTNAANERLAAHLWKHIEDLFTFLHVRGIDATNWRAEQAIRPAVVNRKVWGGNRTTRGAAIQSILISVLRTCHQTARDPLEALSLALRSAQPWSFAGLGGKQ